MSNVLEYRVGDTAPNIPISCTYKTGAVVDLTDCTVDFYITDPNGVTTNSGHSDAPIVSASDGTATYDLTAGDLPTEGTYSGLTKVTLGTGEVMSERRTHIIIVSGQYS